MLGSKRKKLTAMMLDDKMTKETYDAKFNELIYKNKPGKIGIPFGFIEFAEGSIVILRMFWK